MSSGEIMDAYWRAPAIARTITTAVFVTSLLHMVGILPAHWFVFWNQKVFGFPPEIWRVWTNFLFTGPQLDLLFDCYFLYTYTSHMEINNPRFSKREDLVWYMLFTTSITTILASYLLGGGTFLPGLIVAMCRTVTQDQRGQKATIYFFTIPAQLMPFAIMVMTLLFPHGWYKFQIQLCGFAASHLFDFLTKYYPMFIGGPNLAPTPPFLSRFVNTPRVLQRSFGTAIRPGGDQTSGRTTGASAGGGPLPDSWRTRGAGHRLGE